MADRRFAGRYTSYDWLKGGQKTSIKLLVLILLIVAFIISFVELEDKVKISVILTLVASVIGILTVSDNIILVLLFILSVGLVVQTFNDPTMDVLRLITTVLSGIVVAVSLKE